MIVSVEWERSRYKNPPHRFEAGTPNISGAIGLAAAARYLETIGRDRIFAHDQELASHAAASLWACAAEVGYAKLPSLVNMPIPKPAWAYFCMSNSSRRGGIVKAEAQRPPLTTTSPL